MFDDDFLGGYYPPNPIKRHYSIGCKHWREPVRVGRHFVTCSGLLHKKSNLKPIPEFGVYLAVGWRDTLGASWTNGSYLKRLALARAYPALVWEWRDGSVISVDAINDLVEICRAKMKQGKTVDIGCMMGHGRTGTLLACLIARIEHLSAGDAIKITRERYCSGAIEGKGQEKLIADYVANYGVKRRKK